MGYLEFSKNRVSVLVEKQLQFHFHQLWLHNNQHQQEHDYKYFLFRITRKRITWLVSVIIPQTTCQFSVIFAVCEEIV